MVHFLDLAQQDEAQEEHTPSACAHGHLQRLPLREVGVRAGGVGHQRRRRSRIRHAEAPLRQLKGVGFLPSAKHYTTLLMGITSIWEGEASLERLSLFLGLEYPLVVALQKNYGKLGKTGHPSFYLRLGIID